MPHSADSSKPPRIRATALSRRSDFGDRLRSCRLRRGLNTPAMARALGVSKSSVTNWETGVSYPTQPMIPRICDLLDVTPNALYGFPDAEPDLTSQERRALRLYRRVSELDRRNVDALLQAMLENADAALRSECRRRYRVRPRLMDKVCAGSGNELTADGASEPCFLLDCPEVAAADAVITVTGDSMEPTYQDGQDLLVRYAPEILPGEIGIFTVGGQGTVKEYRPDGLHPHNAAHAVIRPEDGTEIRCVGRVLCAVSQAMRPDRQHAEMLSSLFAAGEFA